MVSNMTFFVQNHIVSNIVFFWGGGQNHMVSIMLVGVDTSISNC